VATRRAGAVVEPDCCAAASIDKLLIAGFNHRAGSEAVGTRDRRTGPEQCHTESLAVMG
jgi:hypothetical protein